MKHLKGVKQGDPVMISTKQTHYLGFYQYREKRQVYISMDSEGNYSWGIACADIIGTEAVKY